MQPKNKNNKQYVKLEEDGKIELPIDFDDPGIPKELSKFLEKNNPILTFQFPTNKKNTVIIHFAKHKKNAYNPSEVPSYIR